MTAALSRIWGITVRCAFTAAEPLPSFWASASIQTHVRDHQVNLQGNILTISFSRKKRIQNKPQLPKAATPCTTNLQTANTTTKTNYMKPGPFTIIPIWILTKV